MLYLFKEEALKHFRKGTDVSEDNFYEFFPWNFGPFSSQIYDDLNFFVLRGFIASEAADADTSPESAAEWEMWLSASLPDTSEDTYSEYDEVQFGLTDPGRQFVESKLFSSLSGSQKRLLRNFRANLEQKPLRSILSYVYQKYPTQTVNSTIRDQVIG
jgi:hypothetical protein